MPDRNPNVRIITLGCAKNEVDSEEIAGVLSESGYRVDGGKAADVTVINTCGFLESSKQESIEAIKKAVRSKGKGKVVVAGCLAQRLGEELQRLAPGADAYVGVGQMGRFNEIVQTTMARSEAYVELEPPHHRWADIQSRARTGRPWSAYLKVSEGCDHRCTFCTIPSFRGAHQSKPIERVMEEAQHLARTGAKELNLIAQDVTQYGYDLYQEFTLPKLLKGLNDIDGIEWIRLLYFYPNRLTDEVIEAMATLSKVVKYIDIPLQHVNGEVLRRMKRPWDGERYLAIFRKLRAAMPDCAIRTTFIVGFPGETEAQFKEMVDFCKEAQMDRVGAFLFSREPGTPSYDMENQVPTKVKKDRYDRLMRTQQVISNQKNASWIGRTIRVVCEENRDGWCAARSHRDAPEIDGFVYVRGDQTPGSFIDVNVTDVDPYDLYGVKAGDVEPSKRLLRPLRMTSKPRL